MQNPDDKTQQWLNRTLSPRREPPVRGGLVVDRRERRQFVAAIFSVTFVLVALILIVPKPRSDTPAYNSPAASYQPAKDQSKTLETPATELGTNSIEAEFSKGYPGVRNSAPVFIKLPAGYVPPPAPTWLDNRHDPGGFKLDRPQ